MTPVLSDKLYFLTGVESDELDAATDRLNMEDDEEYMQIVAGFTEEASLIRLG